MGSINDAFIPKENSFKKLERALNFVLSHEQKKSQNLIILKEIGLANHYSFILDFDPSKSLIYFSKNNKSIKNYIKMKKLKSNFVKWAQFLFNINDEDLNSAPYYNQKIESLRKTEFNKSFFQENVIKNLIQKKSGINLLKYGIPKYLRGFIWEIIIAEKYSNYEYYEPKEEQYEYYSFLKKIKKENITNQIDKDLTRTFPDLKDQTAKNLEILKNLLIYSSSLIKDGYCQGLNFIVGFLLKVTNFDEIKTYYFLKNILPHLKGYFENGFPLLKKNKNLFHKLFNKLFPKLNKHFNNKDVFSQFWLGKWLQTLFILYFPFDECCYIWDLLLIKGFDFSIYVCLTIIYYLEKYIISIKKIYVKALEIEKKIENDKNRKNFYLKCDDADSTGTKITKASDSTFSNIILSSLNNSGISSKSVISDNTP